MTFFVVRRNKMNDAKSMLMMYSYAAMKANEDKEETKTKDKTTAETNAKAAKSDKQVKTQRRGKKNDKGREGTDCTITKE